MFDSMLKILYCFIESLITIRKQQMDEKPQYLSEHNWKVHGQICDSGQVANKEEIEKHIIDKTARDLFFDWFRNPKNHDQYALGLSIDAFHRFLRRVFDLKDLGKSQVVINNVKKPLQIFFDHLNPEQNSNEKPLEKNVEIVPIVSVVQIRMLTSLTRYCQASEIGETLTHDWIRFVNDLLTIPGLQVTALPKTDQPSVIKFIGSNVFNSPSLKSYKNQLKQNEYALVLEVDHQRLAINKPTYLWLVLPKSFQEVIYKDASYSVKLPNGETITTKCVNDLIPALEEKGLTAAERPMANARFLSEPKANAHAEKSPAVLVSGKPDVKTEIEKTLGTLASKFRALGSSSTRVNANNNNNEVHDTKIGRAQRKQLIDALKSETYTFVILAPLIEPLDHEFDTPEQLNLFQTKLIEALMIETEKKQPNELSKEHVKELADQLFVQVLANQFGHDF